MVLQHTIKLASDTKRELKAEHNKLKNESHQKAREIITRCAFILEELSYPITEISAKLVDDLPYSQAYIYRILPDKYKRDHRNSTSRISEPATLESPLLIAIYSVVKTAEVGDAIAQAWCGRKAYLATYLRLPLGERQKLYLKLMPRLTIFQAEAPRTQDRLRERLRTRGLTDEDIDRALEGLVLN